MNGRGQKAPMARQMGTMWYTAWIPNISGARPPHEMPFAVQGRGSTSASPRLIAHGEKRSLQLNACAFWPDQRRVPAMERRAGRFASMIVTIMMSYIAFTLSSQHKRTYDI